MKITKIYSRDTDRGLPAVKAVIGDRGRFTAIVSVFGNVDLQGDRVIKGAFTKSLERWQASGDPLPIIWSHSWGQPEAHIGKADPNLARETDAGLEITGTLDVDVGNATADQVYRLLKERRVTQWSFAYDIVRQRAAGDGANELLELHIIEAGPTLAGANPETDTLAVKSAPASIADEIEAEVAELRARVERQSKLRIGTARAAHRTESTNAFRRRMIERHGDTDDVRSALGIPTNTEIAATAEKERLAKAAAGLSLPLGTQRPRLLRVDAQMRPTFEESLPEKRAREAAEDRQAREGQEPAIRVAAWTASTPTKAAPTPEHTVVYDPLHGGIVRERKESTRRAPISGQGPGVGAVWTMPVFAISKESA